MIRLHKHAAILVTKDAEALAELLATESARRCIGPQLSPTAAWIDHRRVHVLREALVRAGYTPKLIRESDPEDGNDAD
jgi:hypothetical protein